MSEGYALFLLLCLLYLSECFLFVRKRSIAFVSPWCGRWKAAVPSVFLGGSRGSVICLNPFFPLGRVYVCHLSPISISPEGVCAFNLQSILKAGRPDEPARALTFDEIRDCTAEGKSLYINRARFVECGDVEQSRALANLINGVAAASPGQRENLIERHLAGRFDGDAAADRLQSQRSRLWLIGTLGSLFFVFLFVLAPVLTLYRGLEPLIIPIALTMVAFAGAIAALFFPVHRHLYPQSREDRLTHLAKMVLCPPGAIRAPDLLTAGLMAHYDPALVASLLHSTDTEAFVESYVRDLRFPIKDELTDPLSLQIVRWYRARLLDGIKGRLQEFVGQKTFAGPDVAEEGGSYCPRCLGQFQIDRGECADCPGVSLTAALATPPSSATVATRR
jgi:hypothetical protein